MKMANKGLLIYPPSQLMDTETPRPDGSLGPLYLASALERKGVETDILDASVGAVEHSLEETFYRSVRQENGLIRIGMDFQKIADYVVREGYSFVGISSNFTPQTKMAFETAKAIKEANPKVRVYAGGVNARALKNRFLASGYFDAICLTEGELIFPEMIKGNLNIPGVAFIHRGKTTENNPDTSCFPEKLDELPIPAWEKLPLDKYKEVSSPHGVDVTKTKKYKYAPILTSRGCPFRCLYCHISEEKKKDGLMGQIGKLRVHSIERVIQEIEILKSKGVEKLFFEDDNLLVKKERVKEIFSKIKDMGLSISNVNGVNLIDFYMGDSRGADGTWEIDKEYLSILKAAGFEQIVFPAESGSQRILKKYASNKVNLEKMNLPLLMKTMSDIGIKAPVNMMIGFPDETEEEIRKSIELGKRLMDSGAPYVAFFMPIPFPGSKLYDIAIRKGYLDKDFNPDLMNWKRAVMKNTKVHPRRLEEIRDKANEEVNRKEFIEEKVKQTVGYRLKSDKY